MKTITSKISICQKVETTKSKFINSEITFPIKSDFKCCNCHFVNNIEIIPYSSGFPIFQLYDDNKILSKEELLENNIVSKTSIWMNHFGELTFNDLPTLYFSIKCQNCDSDYLCVFSCGEKQPGLELLEISGIWEFEYLI
jgi:hypothetical protein